MRAYRAGEITSSHEFNRRFRLHITPPMWHPHDATLRVTATDPALTGCYTGGFMQDPENFNAVPFDQLAAAIRFMKLLKPVSRTYSCYSGDLAMLANDWAYRQDIPHDIYDPIQSGAIILACHALGIGWRRYQYGMNLGLSQGADIAVHKSSMRRIARDLRGYDW